MYKYEILELITRYILIIIAYIQLSNSFYKLIINISVVAQGTFPNQF